MQKKLLSLLIAVIIAISVVTAPGTAVLAASNTSTAKQVMDALGIMKTDKQGNINGTAKVTRGEFSQMLVNLSEYKKTVTGKSNMSLFSDVSKSYWASGYVQTAINKNWMSGYLDGSFKPEKNVTLLTGVNAVLKLLGYTDSDFTGNLISGEMSLYESKKLNKNINKKTNQYLTRNDCMNLFYNTLKATNKEGKVYAVYLGYTLDTKGEVDYLSLINEEMEGPIVVKNGWMSEIPFSYKSAIYYRDGSLCELSDIEDYDVVYYSKGLKTIWAYNNKVTGSIQSIAPDTLNPTTVTVAGKAYTIGSSDMTLAFSTMGNTQKGDLVTLLLDKNDKVVGVMNTDEYNTTITGVVLSTGSHLVTSNAGVVSSKYVSFVDAYGNEYAQDYTVDLNLKVGELVRVIYKNGTASIEKYQPGTALVGIFSSDGSSIENYELSNNVQIIDVHEGKYINVYKKRLAGITVSSASVYYYELNSQGEISQMILSNVTGDLYDYGVLTSCGVSMSSSALTYNYIINGTAGSYTGNSVKDFDLNKGPKGFLLANKSLVETSTLKSARITSVGKTTVNVSTNKYTLADEVAAFYYHDGEYSSTELKKISDTSKYVLTAYYDKSDSEGGRVRVIVAEDNK